MGAHVTKFGILEGSSYVGEGTAALEQTDCFLVEGLTSTDGRAAYREACEAADLPLAWSPHPFVAGLNAVRFSAQLLGDCKARVSIGYVNTQPQFVMRGGCGLYETRTDMDRERRPVWVTNRGSAKTETTVYGDDDEQWQTGLIVAPGSESVFMFERVRPLPAFDSFNGVWPWAHSEAYTDAVNSGTFFGFPRGTVLCESVAYDNSGMAGVANRFVYEFRIRRYGWQPDVAWRNDKTDKSPGDLLKAPGFYLNEPSDPSRTDNAAYGRKIVDWHPYVDFTRLLA